MLQSEAFQIDDVATPAYDPTGLQTIERSIRKRRHAHVHEMRSERVESSADPRVGDGCAGAPRTRLHRGRGNAVVHCAFRIPNKELHQIVQVRASFL